MLQVNPSLYISNVFSSNKLSSSLIVGIEIFANLQTSLIIAHTVTVK